MGKLVFAVIVLFCAQMSFGQASDTAVYKPKDDFSISGFPIAFYLPETGFSFGVVGLTVFNIGQTKAWRKSQVSVGLAFTLKKQLLNFVPYELYFKQHWKLNGELGYYRYFYNYYGIGMDAKAADLETFDANFPRLLSTLSYRVKPSFLAGVQYRFDYFDISEPDSLLSANAPVGLNGGMVSTVGLSSSYDTRDDIFYPRKGVFATFTAETSRNFTFADFDYSMIQLDVMGYYTLKEKHTLAGNFYTGTIIGDAPFFTYFYLSSGKRGRGYNDRRYIDKNIGLAQLEYRFPIYKRFRGAVFSSLGTVGANYSDLFSNRKVWSYGGGLRFQMSKKQMSHLRVDVARGAEGFQFYLTIGEAF